MLSRPWSSILQPFIQGRRRLWLCPKKIERAVGAAPVPDSNPLSTTEARVVRKNRSAGVSPASEPRQLLLGQHDLCRLEAGDTFFLTTTENTEMSQSSQAATNFTAETLVMRKNRSAGVSPACEPG